jgi:hypothetical protein
LEEKIFTEWSSGLEVGERWWGRPLREGRSEGHQEEKGKQEFNVAHLLFSDCRIQNVSEVLKKEFDTFADRKPVD